LKRLVLLLFACASANAQLPPLPETSRSNIEYQSVADALTALRAKPGVAISNQGGWTIVDDAKNYVIWSFAPTGHAAYPAVVKRAIVQKDGMTGINMDVKCESTKEACDALVREFIQLNENMRASFRSGSGGTK